MTPDGPQCMNAGCGCPSVPRKRVARNWHRFGTVKVEWGDLPDGIPSPIEVTVVQSDRISVGDAEALVENLHRALQFAYSLRAEGY